MEIGKVATERNTALEINRSHRNIDIETIKKLKKMGVKFSLGSDAHKSEDVGDFGKAYNIAVLAGLTNVAKQAVKDGCEAYKKYFKKLADRPKFKSRRKSKPSFYHDTDKIKFTQTHVQLEKLGIVKLSEQNRIPVNAKYSNQS